jgi:hypothetical protein
MNKGGCWMGCAVIAFAMPLGAGGSFGLHTARIDPITVVAETGHYDPAPGCNKATDGCYPKVWVAAHDFPLNKDTRVWIRLTINNHTRRTTVTDLGPRWWMTSLIDPMGREPEHPKKDCGVENPYCLMQITATPPTVREIEPGISFEYIDVTRDFLLTTPGTYTASFTVSRLYLLPENPDKSRPFPFAPLQGPEMKALLPVKNFHLPPVRFAMVN